MAGFGNWLNESKLNLTEIVTLRRSTVNLQDWQNIRSDNIGEYATVLQRIPCNHAKIDSLDALYKLWSLYETQQHRRRGGVSATGWIVAGIAGLLLLLIFWVLWKFRRRQHAWRSCVPIWSDDSRYNNNRGSCGLFRSW